jgi:hypothetical protein
MKGTTGTEIQTMEFRNQHFCEKGRLRLHFGVKKCEAKHL